MDRGAWRATVHGVERVGHDLATKPPLPTGGAVIKNLPANVEDARDMGLILGSGRSSWVGNGNHLQYFYLENPMDRGRLQSTSSQESLKIEHTHTNNRSPQWRPVEFICCISSKKDMWLPSLLLSSLFCDIRMMALQTAWQLRRH